MGNSEVSQLLAFLDWEPPGAPDPSSGVWFTDRTVENSFPDSGVEIFGDVDDDSFWFKHRNDMIAKALAKFAPNGTFLEVGAGSGAVAGHLSQLGRTVAAVEPILAGAAATAQRGVVASFCGDLSSLDLPDGAVQAMGAFDVIEHLPHAPDVLMECARVLAPSGTILLTVPAHQWLWSDFDEWNGHVRRYSRRELERQVTGVGLTPVHSTYFFSPLLVPAAISRILASQFRRQERSKEEIEAELAKNLAPGSRLVGRVLEFIHAAEVAAYLNVPIPSGTSILMVAKKEKP